MGGDPDFDASDNDGSTGRMSFLDHLEELRRRLIWAVASIGVGFAITFPFINRVAAPGSLEASGS
jgi:Sec-independent protein secretion pathway component TatC